MKVTRFVTLLVAAFFVLFAPTAASAYEGGEGGVSATPPAPSGNGCYTTQVTVEGEAGTALTLTVTNSDGDEVYSETKTAGPGGSATFTVELCDGGTYTAEGTGPEGEVLGSTQFTIPGSGGQGGGAAGDDGTTTSGSGSSGGTLPATGSDSGTLLTLAGALALLMVGGVTLVAAKRKAL